MLGSYAPRAEPYEYVTPVSTWPAGMLVRGGYVASIRFSDDDKNVHLSCKYMFEIKKTWPTA